MVALVRSKYSNTLSARMKNAKSENFLNVESAV